MNWKTPTLLIASGLFVITANAETKKIVCDEPLTESLTPMVRGMMKKSCDKGVAAGCDGLAKADEMIESCRKSGLQYSARYTFTLDTAVLSGSSTQAFADWDLSTCEFPEPRPTKKVGVESTPSAIIMRLPEQIDALSRFVINRETLVGSYAGKNNWQCRIETVIKKNKI